eukprot:6221326-Ditylum_brightwellii.AAC.1
MSWFRHDTSSSVAPSNNSGKCQPIIQPGCLVRAKKQRLVPLHPHLLELSFSTWARDCTTTVFLMMRTSFMETCYIPAGVSKGNLIGFQSDHALSTIEDRCCKALWEVKGHCRLFRARRFY